MKKFMRILAAVLIVCTLLCTVSCGKEETDVPSGMQKASDDANEYILYVPEDWKVDKSTLYTSAYYSSGDATSISVTAYGLTIGDETLDNWWLGMSEQLNTVYTDITETVEEDAVLGGIYGKKFTFSATLNGQQYNYIIIAVIKDYYVYYMTYTSTPDYYENHLTELDEVVENFVFK